MKPYFNKASLFQICAFSALLALVSPASAFANDAAAAAKKEGVELRIQELHDGLKITAAQEENWAKVADEMRSHAKAAHESVATREKAAKTMTAIEDLKSYADIATVHAEGLKRFIELFAPLYDAMPADQKKLADNVFREHKAGHAMKHEKSLSKKAKND